VQARDLDAALAGVSHDPRSVTRRLRASPSGAAPNVRVGAADGGAAAEEEGSADAEAPPVDLLAMVPGDLAPRLLAPGRWQDKRELLDTLVAAADAPAIAPGDYGELVRALRVLLGDSMVLLVQSSIRALGLLGAGLGAGFRAEACALASPLLDKLKDKNRFLPPPPPLPLSPVLTGHVLSLPPY
jgi:cytoskeleton-associated protein 5